ncbi:MAG: FecR domain-containing protein [Dissulfurispiraceae bacterium]|jgi:hypothetical protein|nr:FecR domain-containing protein [Dissulfurispiraceae bacterium]
MKKFAFIILFVLLILPAYSTASDLGNVYISHLEGDVQINTEETGQWTPAILNMPLKDNDRIWVAQGSRAEIKMKNSSVVRLNELTSADLAASGASDGLRINKGSAYFNFSGSSILNITSPTSRLWTSERAKFRIDVSETGFASTSVFMGRVNSEYNSVRITIPEGRQLPYTGQFTSDLRSLDSADDWDRWNTQRDNNSTGQYASSKYLPEDLSTYSRDFDTHGKWVYVSDYGYCWQPVTMVSAGWAPYRSGRWVWIRGDYVWVSYEPWGWAPYHYGRWAHAASFGWVWIPPARGAVYWGPGFVAWVHTPTYVAWVPLAPREIYYGRGHYGPYSVNITNITVNKTVINKTTYRNAETGHALTTVSRDSFVKGRPMEAKGSVNIFKQKDISFGRPDVKFESPKNANSADNKKVVINSTLIQNNNSAAPENRHKEIPEQRVLKQQREIQPNQRQLVQQQRAIEPQKQVQMKREAEPNKTLQPENAPRIQSAAQQQKLQIDKPQPSVDNKKQAERELQPRVKEQHNIAKPQQQLNNQKAEVQQMPVQQQRVMQSDRKIEQQNTRQTERSFSNPAPAGRQQAEIRRDTPKQLSAPKPQQIEKESRNTQINHAAQTEKSFNRTETTNNKSFAMPARVERQPKTQNSRGRI